MVTFVNASSDTGTGMGLQHGGAARASPSPKVKRSRPGAVTLALTRPAPPPINCLCSILFLSLCRFMRSLETTYTSEAAHEVIIICWLRSVGMLRGGRERGNSESR